MTLSACLSAAGSVSQATARLGSTLVKKSQVVQCSAAKVISGLVAKPSAPRAPRVLSLKQSFLGTTMAHTSQPALDMIHRSEGSLRQGQTDCHYILDDVPNLANFIPGLQKFPNPLSQNPAYAFVETSFVDDEDIVLQLSLTKMHSGGALPCFRRAGPREEICFNPQEVRAAIVTCGGLCPGLNTVIREVVWGLWFQYGVRHIKGIDGGYKGFYARNWMDLDPKRVTDIHKRGGTFLGTSRGGHETSKIVNAIEDRGVNQVYVIGGDGTQRGALKIYEECRRRGLAVAVAGIPKTIDNDIPIIDKSFGFDTAVEEAQRAINAAHVEAESTHNCVGIVKLMGRDCGQIAMHATLASRDVDCCLCPEAPFHLEGEEGLLQFIENRLMENDHCVIVLAEGAGQELIKAEIERLPPVEKDASGNRALLDIGLWLSEHIKRHFASIKKEISLKYIDPTYMIRAIPANASDNIYCTLLAHSAIHGAMAGYSGFISGPVNGRHCYIPIDRVCHTYNKVSLTDRMWARLLASTSQPTFLRFNSPDAMRQRPLPQATQQLSQAISFTTAKDGLTSVVAVAAAARGTPPPLASQRGGGVKVEADDIPAAVSMPSSNHLPLVSSDDKPQVN